MMIRRERPAAAAAICLAFAACGGDHAGPDGQSYSLALVGSVNLVMHPLEKRTLQVLLAQDQAGAVSNAQIHFELQGGDASQGALDSSDVATGADGVASVTFTAGPSATSRPTFKLVASAEALGPPPVAFGLTVIPLHRLLQIVGSATTRPKADGASATVALTSSATFALKLREIDADTGTAISGDTVQFTLPPTAKSHWSGAAASISAITGAGGEAQASLLTTSSAEAPFLIQAVSASGGPAVTFAVTVASPQAPPIGVVSPGCSDDLGCPSGYSCLSGVCQPPAGSECDPAAASCASGFCCDGSQCVSDCAETCAAGSHCVAGEACGGGSCVSDSTVPDVTGLWSTRHDFDIAATLSFLSRATFAELRILDQAMRGKLTFAGLPGFLQDIINTFSSALLQRYLPDWFQQLVIIGDDLGTLLTNLRGEGSMSLVRNGDLTHLRGTETWTSLVFYWLPLCGGEIQGDPAHPPECARIELATSASSTADFDGTRRCQDQQLPVIDVQAQPFTATVTGSGPYSLQVDERSVKLEMGKVALLLADSMVEVVSEGQYRCVDEATDCSAGRSCIVDCPGLASDISSAIDGVVPARTLKPLCVEAVAGVGKLVSAALANAWDPSVVQTLQFRGSATINDSQLGDGSWSGTFFSVKNLPGAWQATRPE